MVNGRRIIKTNVEEIVLRAPGLLCRYFSCFIITQFYHTLVTAKVTGKVSALATPPMTARVAAPAIARGRMAWTRLR